MQFHALAAVAALLATTQASSISDYYGKDCGLPINKIQEGSTPTECNTQQGASLGYTLDKACSLTFYSDIYCNLISQQFGSATKGCHDFDGTKGSWRFYC